MQSVLEQDYQQMEYIVVDGGSTDGSVDTIRMYADRLAWWVSERDRGQGEAINKGMAHARGEIVAWLNSDDLYLPGAVSQAVDVFQTHPDVGLVYGNAVTIDTHGVPLNILSFGDWEWRDLLGFRIICQPAVFMRRELFERAGGMSEGYHFMLDHHLWLRIASQASIYHIPDILAAARHHQNAKNVSHAEGFAQETGRVLGFIRQKFTDRIATQDWRFIEGGALRLQGRYYLDGGKPGKALAAYRDAFLRRPLYTLQHAHRILYAGLSLAGIQHRLDGIQRSRSGEFKQRAALTVRARLEKFHCATWVGIK